MVWGDEGSGQWSGGNERRRDETRTSERRREEEVGGGGRRWAAPGAARLFGRHGLNGYDLGDAGRGEQRVASEARRLCTQR